MSPPSSEQLPLTSLRFSRRNNQQLIQVKKILMRNFPAAIIRLKDVLPIIMKFLLILLQSKGDFLLKLQEIKMPVPQISRDLTIYLIEKESRKDYQDLLSEIASIKIEQNPDFWIIGWDREMRHDHDFITDQYITLILFLFAQSLVILNSIEVDALLMPILKAYTKEKKGEK